MGMALEELCDVRDIQRAFNVSAETVYRWCRTGVLTPVSLPNEAGVRIPRRYRFRVSDIERILAGGSV
jgi:predicted site-specific integrase-resolvase